MENDNTQGGAEPSPASAGSHGPDIVERLRACETRPLTTMSEECRAVTRDPAAWVELWKTLNDARAEIERLRPSGDELEAIWTVSEAYAENDGDPECERIARIMQGLWHRTK